MFKELSVVKCEDDYMKAMNYLILGLTALIAVAEVIFDRLENVTIVCQIVKRLLTLQKYKSLNWRHRALFNVLRSATNIFLCGMMNDEIMNRK